MKTEDGATSANHFVTQETNWSHTGINPKSLGVLRGEDPKGYLKAYRAEYSRRKKAHLSNLAKAKYQEVNKEKLDELRQKREAKKLQKVLDRVEAKRLTAVKRSAIKAVAEMDGHILRKAREKRKRAQAKERRKLKPWVGWERRTKKVAWATWEELWTFTIKARQMTAETGTVHHTDHIYPINGNRVCGLHTPANLRVVTQKVNSEKSNMMPGFLAEELWDPEGSDVYHDGDPYTPAERRRLEREAARKEAADKARAEHLAKLGRAARDRAKAKALLDPGEPKPRGRKLMTAEKASAMPAVQALLSGMPIREAARTFGKHTQAIKRYAMLVDPDYKSPCQKHGRMKAVFDPQVPRSRRARVPQESMQVN